MLELGEDEGGAGYLGDAARAGGDVLLDFLPENWGVVLISVDHLGSAHLRRKPTLPVAARSG